jgi:hypothetical protein
MLRHTNEHHVTYLNKGQTYSLKVADSKPPIRDIALVQYRTFVRVSFEEQDQRSDPVASWQLWKDGRGRNEANKRRSELLAVEYIDPLQDSAGCKGHHQIWLEKTYVDGFCVTWTADPMRKVSECLIPLRFNFLSTDFSRSKGVKGVPVRLCTKTELLRPEGVKRTTEHDSEMCYCAIKLFRDHGAERKLSNDVAHIKKKIEKLNQQITDRELGSDFVRSIHDNNSRNRGQFNHWPRKGKSSMKPWKPPTTENLRFELALTHKLFSSARQVSVLGFCGAEQDDPDLHPVTLPRGTDDLIKNECMDNQHMEDATMAPIRYSTELNVRSYRHQSPINIQHPLEFPGIPAGDMQNSVSPATLSSTAGSYCYFRIYFVASYLPYLVTVACFYVQINQNGKLAPSYHHAIYLAERTSLDLKEKLCEKMLVDPRLIARILWGNSNGLEVMVDDDMVQHIPEGQIMTADISEVSCIEVASAGLKPSVAEIKLVF